MKILCVEDEEGIAEIIQMGLEAAGYSVELAHDGPSGLERAIEGGWSAIVLDWMLPGFDGLELLRRLRARRDRTPVLMLTARDTLPDEVRGLETGADDYLPKPFAVERLVAHIRALLRRESAQRSNTVKLRDLEIDIAHHQIKRNGMDVPLTPREWAVFETLLRNEGRPVHRDTLRQQVWYDEAAVGSNVIDVYIRLLRTKLDDNSETKLIRTIYGLGYVLERPAP